DEIPIGRMGRDDRTDCVGGFGRFVCVPFQGVRSATPHYDPRVNTNDAKTNESPNESLNSTTWATLLAGWVQFAQSAVALPRDEQGQRWRDSIAPTISLHA